MLKILTKYRQLIIGVCIGSILFSIFPIKAAIEEYICYKADYRVMINGKEYKDPDLPILNYKGYTYAPLRSMLEAAGLNINWNAELGIAEITTPEPEKNEPSKETNTTPDNEKEPETPSTTEPDTTEPDTTTPTDPNLPENFNDAKLPNGMEYVWYNDSWCIKYNGEYYMEMSLLIQKYKPLGLVLVGRGYKIEKGIKIYNTNIYENSNTKQTYEIDITGENLDDSINVGGHIYLNLKLIINLFGGL